MGLRMNKPAYEKLIAQDIAFLNDKTEQSIRRTHIKSVLQESIKLLYPSLKKPQNFSCECGVLNIDLLPGQRCICGETFKG